jgi:hypothetical protein
MKDTAYGVKGLIEPGEAFRTVSEGAAPAAPTPARRRARVFHTTMAVAFLVTAFAGFAPTYFLRGLSHRPPLSPLLHVHGLAFTSWLVLLLVQTSLVARHRVDWHRRLGIAGAALATVMVPLGVAASIAGARHGLAVKGPEALTFLIFPLGQITMFAAFVGAAMWKRKTPEIHRRLILLSTAVLITPAISRLPFGGNPVVSLLLTALFVVAAMIHDWKARGRVHSLYVWGVLVILLSGPVRFALGHTDAWQSVARWLVR